MAKPNSVGEFIEIVRKSGLIEPAKLDGFLASQQTKLDTADALATKLHAHGFLTQFQLKQLAKGKHKGFFLGKYRLLDRIGMGGMGQVFLAEHSTMRRRVALKVVPPDKMGSDYTRERFLREARAGGQLDHPNLVRAYDVDQDGDVMFLIMEHVVGMNFHDIVTHSGPLAPARVGNYLWQTAQGLGYMHGHHLIHRDIKPANLLLTRDGVVKILDLGLVRSQVDEDNLTVGEGVKVLGTADFIAPEQAIDCTKVDIRADLYALGATAYFMLTGKPPFDCEHVAQKLIAHQTKPVRPIKEFRNDVPEELLQVINKLLAKKPSQRYQTPQELATALNVWGVMTPPPPAANELSESGLLGASQPDVVSLSSTSKPSQVSSTSGSQIGYHSGGLSKGASVMKAPTPPPLPAIPTPRHDAPKTLQQLLPTLPPVNESTRLPVTPRTTHDSQTLERPKKSQQGWGKHWWALLVVLGIMLGIGVRELFLAKDLNATPTTTSKANS